MVDMGGAWQGMVGMVGCGDKTDARRAVWEEGEGSWAMGITPSTHPPHVANLTIFIS